MSELPKTGNRIVDLSFAFALKIVAYTERLEELKKYVISNQLLKKWNIRWCKCKGSSKL